MPQPVVREDQVVVRSVMKVALSADHRGQRWRGRRAVHQGNPVAAGEPGQPRALDEARAGSCAGLNGLIFRWIAATSCATEVEKRPTHHL